MVYFMQPIEGGPVKIGYSVNVEARRRQLERHFGKPLAILATRDGGYVEEQELHARFAHLRFDGTEQFRPAPELMAFLGRPLLVGANPEAVEAMAVPSPVRIASDLASMAKYLAAQRGINLADLLSDILRPHITKEFKKAAPDVLGRRDS